MSRRPDLGTTTVDRCLNCHYYDRNPSTGAGGKSANAGQCRRNAPMLSPVNPKTYMIEGVWPTIRDEDWCGEYRAGVRRSETSRADALLATLTPAVPRMGAAAAAPLSIGALRGGDD